MSQKRLLLVVRSTREYQELGILPPDPTVRFFALVRGKRKHVGKRKEVSLHGPLRDPDSVITESTAQLGYSGLGWIGGMRRSSSHCRYSAILPHAI